MTLEQRLQLCVDAGVARWATDEEIAEATKPLVRDLLRKMHIECLRIIRKKAKS